MRRNDLASSALSGSDGTHPESLPRGSSNHVLYGFIEVGEKVDPGDGGPKCEKILVRKLLGDRFAELSCFSIGRAGESGQVNLGSPETHDPVQPGACLIGTAFFQTSKYENPD